MIKRVAILGAGLLGGSVAISAQQHIPNLEVVLWARNPDAVTQAKAIGLSGATTDFEEAISGADLIILATPVGIMESLATRLLKIRGNETFIITDVGSVKRLPHDKIDSLVEDTQVSYVGSHPMAGSEKKGISAAFGELLNGAACIVTSNDMERDAEDIASLDAFWSALGCRVRQMSPEDHDYAVARISHFPHAMASMTAMVGLSFEDIAELAGGGLRDTTRVAAGDPELWTEIMLENRDALQRSVAESICELNHFQQILKENDVDAMQKYLVEAKRRRDLI